LADAARAAQRAIDLLPSDASYWVTRGMISSDQDLSSEAQASFRNALKLNPKLFEAHYLLGRSYHRTSGFADAIGAYRKAMRLAPERPEVYFDLARALSEADRAQEALDAFQRAFAADREGRLDRRQCLDCFRRLPVKSLPAFWQSELARFFDRQDIDKSRYVMGGLYALMSKPAFRALGAGDAREGSKPAVALHVVVRWCIARTRSAAVPVRPRPAMLQQRIRLRRERGRNCDSRRTFASHPQCAPGAPERR